MVGVRSGESSTTGNDQNLGVGCFVMKGGEVTFSLMDKVGFWNVRGLNSPKKHGDVRNLLHSHNYGLFGLQETRVKSCNFHKNGSVITLSEVEGIRTCLRDCGLLELESTGPFYTWSNKQEGVERVFSKIDRVFVNELWSVKFPDSLANFLLKSVSDHNACIIQLELLRNSKPKPFKFFNMWTTAPMYIEIIMQGWQKNVQGCEMFKVVKKMKMLKQDIRVLNRSKFSNIENEAEIAYKRMIEAQRNVHASPSDSVLHQIETEDMLRHYKRKSEPARCTIKLDLMKAYDSLSWDFLKELLQGLGFPDKFVNWVMICVTSPSYTLSINGSLCGFFAGEVQSAILLKRVLKTFSDTSGLFASQEKTALYFGNVKEEVQARILQVTRFQRGTFPFRYLGVRITSKRLAKSDCDALVDKIVKRIVCLSSRHLSYAGRYVLINSVLLSLHTYWAKVFPSSKGCIGQYCSDL
ncbi:uncharacterized protein LOC125494804 [Beta vulgaris subsp. vulgaris]|uniref:uncharacterized protein LOC125494804 n=1 Tax=Beta vulgaris subsp. vulgaris TaxID=3555 RepID=UPI0020368232|nr:uncharacterized protein LOC125494804 [Beta vulgaris subsp. vulgaris]